MPKNHRTRNLAIGGAILAGASYVAGILTAPKSGRETRKDIHKAAHKAKKEAEKKLKLAHSELNTLLDKLGVEVKKGQTTVNKELKAALAQAETVRKKTREIISALHEGESEDANLDEAVKEARAAIKHLKSFVIK